MSGFELNGWPLLGALLIMLSGGVIIGAAVGYFTAATDLQRERANTWERGARGIHAAIKPKAAPRDGYVFTSPAIPIPVVGPGPLFDQDAPTSAAVAIELRGDN